MDIDEHHRVHVKAPSLTRGLGGLPSPLSASIRFQLCFFGFLLLSRTLPSPFSPPDSDVITRARLFTGCPRARSRAARHPPRALPRLRPDATVLLGGEMKDLQGELQQSKQDSQEEANVLNVLRTDIKKVTHQRQELQLAHERLHHNILDMLRITLGMEEQICCRLGVCTARDKSGDAISSTQTARGGGDPQETGVMEGCVAEKAALAEKEEEPQERKAKEQSLEKELENTRAQLQDLREGHTLLLQQRDTFSSGLGQAEKVLMVELERLGRELVEVQQQAEQDRRTLETRLRMLEAALEEREDNRRAQVENLQRMVCTLEKQLKLHQQFINEQAVERKQERDKFQQEIKNLEAKLRLSTKVHLGGECSGQKVPEEKQMETDELRAQVERLRGERQAREEEVERLQQVIHKLQEELNLTESKRNPEPPDFSEESLDHKLNSQSVCLSHPSLCEMEMKHKSLMEENKALQQMLLFQEEHYGQQVVTLTQSLVNAQENVELLEKEAAELRVRPMCEEVKVEKLEVATETELDGNKNATSLAEEKKDEQKTPVLRLRQKIQRLEQEIEAISGQTEKLNSQMEEREAQKDKSQKQVMETLARASAVLQEKDKELTHLKAENSTLRTELTAVREGLSTNNNGTEHLQEEGQLEPPSQQASRLKQLESQLEQERKTVRNLHATIRKLRSELQKEQSYWESVVADMK